MHLVGILFPHTNIYTPKNFAFTKLHGDLSQKSVTFGRFFWKNLHCTNTERPTYWKQKTFNTTDGHNDNNYSEHDNDNDGDVDDNYHKKIIIPATTGQSVNLLALEPINSDTEKIQ